jgi:large conductance mechanosensitive channel
MGAILKDFRDFIGKGSAVDLAIGLIVGSAIGAILKSFVDELIIPLTGLITRVDFSNMYFVLKGDVPEGKPLAEARKITGVVALGYGQFLTVAINTLILAFAVFIVVRAVNKLKARIEHEDRKDPPPPPPPTPEVKLLTEIRDLLKPAVVDGTPDMAGRTLR